MTGVYAVPCRYCRAPVGVRCRTRTGQPTKPHNDRACHAEHIRRPRRTDDDPNDPEGAALLVALAHYMAERLAAGDDDQAEKAADAAFDLRGQRIFNDR